jgi:hypothetical protein
MHPGEHASQRDTKGQKGRSGVVAITFLIGLPALRSTYGRANDAWGLGACDWSAVISGTAALGG